MKSLRFSLLFALLAMAFACEKDTQTPAPVAPLPPPEVYVPIFQPGDTSKGAAYANKLTKFWRASVYCKTAYLDSTKIGIQFFTYTTNGSTREQVILGAVSKIGGVGQYGFYTDIHAAPPPAEVYTSYGRWASDGDLLEDYYRVDSTDVKNRLVITKIDLPNKRVEGTFHVSYKLQGPRRNPANPFDVTFSEGHFWATIRD